MQDLVNSYWQAIADGEYKTANKSSLACHLDVDYKTIQQYIDRKQTQIDEQEAIKISDILARCLRRIEAMLADKLFDNTSYKGAALALKVGFNWRDQLDINTNTERRIVIAPAIDETGDVGLLPAGALDE